MAESCDTCRFSVLEPAIGFGQMTCHRRAPIALISTYEPIAANEREKTWQRTEYGGWPKIYGTWWCGEYEAKR